MAVSRRLRFEILRRDEYTCRYCGASAPDVKLEVDHVIAVTLGGGDTANNLVTACEDCNRGKSSTSISGVLVDDVDETAALVARAQQLASERRQVEIANLEAIVEEFGDLYREHAAYRPGENGYRDSDNWETSTERFLSEGLSLADLVYFAKVTGRASPKKPWSYFCGCCWREITRRQEETRRIIEDGEV